MYTALRGAYFKCVFCFVFPKGLALGLGLDVGSSWSAPTCKIEIWYERPIGRLSQCPSCFSAWAYVVGGGMETDCKA